MRRPFCAPIAHYMMRVHGAAQSGLRDLEFLMRRPMFSLPLDRSRWLARAAVVACLAVQAMFSLGAAAEAAGYAWKPASARDAAVADTLAQRIAPPPGFTRTPSPDGSFAAWLRGLPMKAADAPVLLHTGARKWRQDVHVAVVDIDTGARDLQQCADAIMRLRAEWLWSAGRRAEIGFNYTDGKRRTFSATGKSDYPSFRKYMDLVFAYAGTYSLERELKPVVSETRLRHEAADIAIGDVFIKGGFPGHAVLVADMATNAAGEKRFLLLQSFMPAQEIHVLKNPTAPVHSPWYAAPVTYPFVTPEWTFPAGSLKRWP